MDSLLLLDLVASGGQKDPFALSGALYTNRDCLGDTGNSRADTIAKLGATGAANYFQHGDRPPDISVGFDQAIGAVGML